MIDRGGFCWLASLAFAHLSWNWTLANSMTDMLHVPLRRNAAWFLKGDGIAVPMDIRVGDVLTMKKKHPCGSVEWLVLRSGMDFRLRCQGCGHEVLIPRAKAEKGIKAVHRPPA